MKILIYRWNAWNQADVEESLTFLGHEISHLTEKPKSMEEDSAFVDVLSERLRREPPDCLFSINFFPVLSDSCQLAGIPYVCWNCDGSLLSMYHESVFHETNFIFTLDKGCIPRFQALGVSHIWHLPLGVCSRRLRRITGHKTDHPFDISFVGSLYTKNSFDSIADRLPDYLAGYLDGALSAQQIISGGNLLEPLLTPQICQKLEELTDYRRSERSFAGVRELFASTVLGFKAANLERTHILCRLARDAVTWDKRAVVHLFTDDGGENLPLVQIHPPVDYLTQMPKVFVGSTVNLNSTVPTILTGIPLRVWDILGCGGFLLTNYQAELCDYFEPDRHLALFEDTEELLAKAEFYCAHPECTASIAALSRTLVLENHTWDIRLKQLFHTLNGYL